MLKAPTTWQITSGHTDYEFALATMRERAAAIRAGTEGELIWLVEHPPLYTAGTSAAAGDLQDADRFPTYQAGRGGQWTYHGPGQRVAYLMLDLNETHGSIPPRDIRAYVAGLENWVIATLKTFGIKGETRAGRVGIWVVTGNEEQKIAAIGVRVSRWVTWHGLALNVHPDLSHFGGIIPCGIREHGVTSLAALGVTASMNEVDAALRENFEPIFG
ncbi:lipoyl(octanoyl) transferase LipB [Acidocella sp.]|jgi:lipoyl(octanoyl) transferase|uniref:lipoyl(octanoyl) transferase LipB n=1 Tax=Acidocella sp. TaxID=50710 RepID=UPI002F408C4A